MLVDRGHRQINMFQNLWDLVNVWAKLLIWENTDVHRVPHYCCVAKMKQGDHQCVKTFVTKLRVDCHVRLKQSKYLHPLKCTAPRWPQGRSTLVATVTRLDTCGKGQWWKELPTLSGQHLHTTLLQHRQIADDSTAYSHSWLRLWMIKNQLQLHGPTDYGEF